MKNTIEQIQFMKVIILFIIVSFTIPIGCVGQLTAKSENANTIKNCILAVVKVEGDQDDIKKIKRKNQDLSAYENSIEALNGYLEEIVPAVWTLSKSIEFVSAEQAEKIRQSNNKNYCILEFKKYAYFKEGDIFYLGKDKYDESPQWSLLGNEKAFTLSWAGGSGTIAKSFYPAAQVSKGFLTFTLQFLKAQIEASSRGIEKLKEFDADVETRNALLKEKILLINDPFICKPLGKIIEAKKFDKYYDHPYEVAGLAKVEEVILNKDPKYAYLITAPDGIAGYFSHFVVDAKDGTILYFTQKINPPYNQFYTHLHFNGLNKAISK